MGSSNNLGVVFAVKPRASSKNLVLWLGDVGVLAGGGVGRWMRVGRVLVGPTTSKSSLVSDARQPIHLRFRIPVGGQLMNI